MGTSIYQLTNQLTRWNRNQPNQPTSQPANHLPTSKGLGRYLRAVIHKICSYNHGSLEAWGPQRSKCQLGTMTSAMDHRFLAGKGTQQKGVCNLSSRVSINHSDRLTTKKSKKNLGRFGSCARSSIIIDPLMLGVHKLYLSPFLVAWGHHGPSVCRASHGKRRMERSLGHRSRLGKTGF